VIRSAFILLLCLASQLPAAELSVRVTPPVIQMGTFYKSGQVRVTGISDRGTALVIVVWGAEEAETFNVKGREGPIWVNVGKAKISGVPSLFLCFSPQSVRSFLSGEIVEQYGFDLVSLKKQMRIEPSRMDRDFIRTNFLKLKTDEDSYRFADGVVKMGDPSGDGTPYTAEFNWPKKAPPGSYEVQVYEAREGSIVRESRAPLTAVEVGFPALMSSMARNRAALYGLLAVLVTMLAGFGMDFLVSRARRKGRPPSRRVPPAVPVEPEIEGARAEAGNEAKMKETHYEDYKA
jgi:hypothetical protein